MGTPRSPTADPEAMGRDVQTQTFDRLGPARRRMQRNLLLTALAGAPISAFFATLVGNAAWPPAMLSVALCGSAVLLSRFAPSWAAV